MFKVTDWEIFRYRCCKQHSLGRGSHIPLLLPSPGRRWLPGLAEVFHGPGKRGVTIFSAAPVMLERFLPHIYFGTCGMSSSKTSKEARLHWEWVARIMESSKMSCTHFSRNSPPMKHKRQKVWNLGERNWGESLLDPRPGDVLLPLRHPPGYIRY